MSTLHLIMTPGGLAQALHSIQADDNVILFDQKPCSLNCAQVWTSYLTQPDLDSDSDSDSDAGLNADQVAKQIAHAPRIETW